MSRMVPDEVLLGLLIHMPSYGYELLDYFRSNTALARVWTMSTSQLYAVLKRLEDKGAIAGQVVSTEEAPDRIEYTVTKVGLQQLNDWLYEAQPSTSIHKIRVMFMSRLYIASLLVNPVDEIIENQILVCERQMQKYQQERCHHGSSIEALTLDFIIGQLSAALIFLYKSKIHFPLNDI